MQDELAAERPDLAIDLLHVNEDGYESGIPDLVEVTDLPILQDDPTQLVWDGWAATWRDVYVLDGDNEVYAVYNLTDHDLADPVNYAELYALFVAAAGG